MVVVNGMKPTAVLADLADKTGSASILLTAKESEICIYWKSNER